MTAIRPTFQTSSEISSDSRAQRGLRESATFDRAAIAAIQRAAETGIYDIRGWGAKRALPHFDDLLFLGASMSRYPLEGTASAVEPMWWWATVMPNGRCGWPFRSPSPE